MRTVTCCTLVAMALAFAAGPAAASNASARAHILAGFLAQARKEDPGFKGFSAARGDAFFHAHHTGGHPQTPSCTTCHTQNPRNVGHTRTGKALRPVAISRTPSRFTDPEKVAKWFRRNCRTVLGRDCTAKEKGDYITYMMSQ